MAGSDDLQRSETLNLVRNYSTDQPLGGFEFERADVLDLVRYYITR